MGDTETVALLDPETEADDELTPADDGEETDAPDGAETEDGEDSPETETFTAEDIERARKEAEEAVRAEARIEAEQAALTQQRDANKAWMNSVGEGQIRNLVLWAGKQVADGKDPEAVAAQVQRVAIQQHVDGMQSFVLQSTFDSLAGHFDAYLAKEFPDFKADNALQSEFTREVASKQAERAFVALYKKMQAAVEAAVVPKRLEEVQKAAAEKNRKGEAVAALKTPPKTGGPMKGGGGAPRGADIRGMSLEELVKLEEDGKLDDLIVRSHKRASL